MSFKIASELRILNSQEAASTLAWSVINLIHLEDHGPSRHLIFSLPGEKKKKIENKRKRKV